MNLFLPYCCSSCDWAGLLSSVVAQKAPSKRSTHDRDSASDHPDKLDIILNSASGPKAPQPSPQLSGSVLGSQSTRCEESRWSTEAHANVLVFSTFVKQPSLCAACTRWRATQCFPTLPATCARIISKALLRRHQLDLLLWAAPWAAAAAAQCWLKCSSGRCGGRIFSWRAPLGAALLAR